MEKAIYEAIKSDSKRIFDISELISKTEKQFGGENFEINGGYRSFAAYIKAFCDKGLLEPVKSSGTNGRNPSLFNRYRITLPDEDKKPGEELLNELHSLHP